MPKPPPTAMLYPKTLLSLYIKKIAISFVRTSTELSSGIVIPILNFLGK